MNKRAFRRALRYGFGRAILHLQQHDATPYRDDILDGCLHFWGYDGDFDTDRPDYMYEVISLTGELEFFRNHILGAVETASDDRNGNQIFTLARLYAEAGDDYARSALDRALERMPFHENLAACEIKRRGPDGLLRVIRLQLEFLDQHGDIEHNVADFGLAIEEAQELWGKRAFTSFMSKAGREDSRIKVHWKQIQQDIEDWSPKTGPRPEPIILTYHQVKMGLADPGTVKLLDGSHPSRLLGHWAKNANDDEWRTLCDELVALPVADIQWSRAMRFLFNRRAFEGDPQRLISTVRAARLDRVRSAEYDEVPDTEARYAIHSLAKMSHPDVRSFALELLANSKWTSHAATLLEANYAEGDVQFLAAGFRRERSEWQRHGIGISIRNIDKQHSPPDAPFVLRMLYEHVRCGLCRRGFVERLHAHGDLPAAIVEECRFDAYLELRELIAELVPNYVPDAKIPA